MSFASFRKPKAKALRQKVDEPTEDNEEEELVVRTPRKPTNAKSSKSVLAASSSKINNAGSKKTEGGEQDRTKAKTTPKNKSSSLSFGVDDDAEELDSFVPKKSSASKRMIKAQVDRELVPERETITSSASMYSTENMQALRADQKRRPAPQKEPSLFSGGLNLDEMDTVIPDAAAIHAAKKLREQKRAAGISGISETTGESFIPLSGSREVARSNKAESRLVNEDDEEEGEEPFEDHAGDRIHFGGDAVQKEELRRKAEREGNFVTAQEEDSEEEIHRWELEQIRKGGRTKLKEDLQSSRPQTYKIPASASIPSVGEVCARLNAALAALELSQKTHVSQLEQLKAEAAKSLKATKDLQNDTKGAAARYDFYQDFSTFVGDFAEFLDTKGLELEKCEREVRRLLKRESDDVAAKRRQSLNSWCRGLDLLPRSTPSDAMDVDEDISDDDDDEPLTDFDAINDRLEHLFVDATKEFRSLKHIVHRMKSWKENYPTEYKDSYGELSLVGIFEIFVRRELIQKGICRSPGNFEDMEWVRWLYDYASDSETEVETALFQRIMDKTVIPQLKLYTGDQIAR
ncbi:nineteen complex-related protein 2-domain-containing protein [Phlyctochytrium arcticum]|nr:nineteen complex-related protein 2-domain-containing protein [Phlyctochytrium arcticum]